MKKVKVFFIFAYASGYANYLEDATNQINERLESLGLNTEDVISISERIEEGLGSALKNCFTVFYRTNKE